MKSKKAKLLLFATSTMRMKTTLCNQSADSPENVNVALEGYVHWYSEGPQRNPVEGLQSHQCRTQSPWKEKEALSGQMAGNREELATAHTICSPGQNMIKVLNWVSVTR